MILVMERSNQEIIKMMVKFAEFFDQEILRWPMKNFNKRMPKGVTAVLSEGVGVGALLFKQCKDLGIDFYVFDNGYFPNHRLEYFKICKNRLNEITINDNINSKRYENIFGSNEIKNWNNRFYDEDSHILILPPSSYEKFYYGDYYWTDDIIQRLADSGYKGKIKVRYRDRDNIYNTYNLRLLANKVKYDTTYVQDIENAYAVISHSSTWAVYALLNGRSVYTSEHGPGYPLNFDFDDLVKTYPNPLPKPKQLEQYIYTLAYSNFNYQEIESGYAWMVMNN